MLFSRLRGFDNIAVAMTLVTASAVTAPLAQAEERRIRVPDCIFRSIYRAEAKAGNTTGLRQETSYVVKAVEADKLLEDLKKIVGDPGRFKLRDEPPSGKVNVTETDYTIQVDIENVPGAPILQDRGAKIRMRRYGSRPAGTSEPFALNGNFKAFSKLEIKLHHQTHENVVYKPSIFLDNSDIEVLLNGSKSFYGNPNEQKFNEIRKKAYELNPDHGSEVDQVFDTLKALYDEVEKQLRGKGFLRQRILPKTKLIPISTTEYERTAYEIKVPNPDGGEDIRVQVTIDQNIRYRRPGQGSGGRRGDYKPDDRVVEVKIPLDVAQIDIRELRTLNPQIAQIRERVEAMRRVTQRGFPEGSGKSSARKAYEDTRPLQQAKKSSRKLAKLLAKTTARLLVRQSVKSAMTLTFLGAVYYFATGENPIPALERVVTGFFSIKKNKDNDSLKQLEELLDRLQRVQLAKNFEKLDSQLNSALKRMHVETLLFSEDKEKKARDETWSNLKKGVSQLLEDKSDDGAVSRELMESTASLYFLEKSPPISSSSPELLRALERMKDDPEFLALLKKKTAELAGWVSIIRNWVAGRKTHDHH